MPSRTKKMRVVESWDQVPPFTSEEDEATYWATHELGQGLLDEMGPVENDVLPPPRPRTKPVAIRFDDATIRRLKAVAARRHKGYPTLLKEFVIERLYEEEKRDGLVG